MRGEGSGVNRVARVDQTEKMLFEQRMAGRALAWGYLGVSIPGRGNKHRALG